jgi:hypothetical protein
MSSEHPYRPQRAIPKRQLRRTFARRARTAMHVTVGAKGSVEWEVTDRDGTTAQQGASSNLIVDRGMDQLLTSSFLNIRQYFCGGTSSTAPANNQTTLGAEVFRTSSTGGFTAAADAFAIAGGVLTGTFQVVRVMTFSSAYNLTEFGFSESSTAGGVVAIRELFRDGSNNPLTVSVQNGQQLKMTHNLSLSVPYSAAGVAPDFTITNLGVMSSKFTFFSFAQNATSYGKIFTEALGSGVPNLWAMTAANDNSPTTQGAYTTTQTSNSATLSTYVAGSFTRTKSMKYTTAQSNHDHYGWYVTGSYLPYNNNGPQEGFKVCLTNPVKITKDATYELTLDFQISYARVS